MKNAPTRQTLLAALLVGFFLLVIVIGHVAVNGHNEAVFFSKMRELPPEAGYASFFSMLVFAVVSGIIPLSALAMASGVLYGIGLGFVISGIGISIGAALAFAIGRYWLRKPVSKWVSRYIPVSILDHSISRRGWQLSLLMRISPVAPFGMVSYAFGLTSVTFAQFMLGLTGSFPALFVYVYSGAVSGEMLRAFLSGDPQVDRFRLILLVLGFVATLGGVFLLVRIMREILAESS